MKRKVLIVDDDSSFVSGLMSFILNKEITISIADSLKRAKFLIKNDNYDLILANVKIPGGCSLELKNEFNITSGTHFLFMSNLDSDYNFIKEKGEQCYYKYNLNNSIGEIFNQCIK